MNIILINHYAGSPEMGMSLLLPDIPVNNAASLVDFCAMSKGYSKSKYIRCII